MLSDATIRHYKFLLKGLQEVEGECNRLNIKFHLLFGESGKMVPKFLKENNFGGLVCDFSPLRLPLEWVCSVKESLPENVPFCQVDAHNIVPVWVTSDKQEAAAHTIRNKINGKLNVFLTKFPPVIKHPYNVKLTTTDQIDWEKAFDTIDVDLSVDEVKWCRPGYKAGIEMLESFIEKRLRSYNSKRNIPIVDATSNLSPWFHFGKIIELLNFLLLPKIFLIVFLRPSFSSTYNSRSK